MKWTFAVSVEKWDLLTHGATIIQGSRDGVKLELSRIDPDGDLMVIVEVPRYELLLELLAEHLPNARSRQPKGHPTLPPEA